MPDASQPLRFDATYFSTDAAFWRRQGSREAYEVISGMFGRRPRSTGPVEVRGVVDPNFSSMEHRILLERVGDLVHVEHSIRGEMHPDLQSILWEHFAAILDNGQFIEWTDIANRARAVVPTPDGTISVTHRYRCLRIREFIAGLDRTNRIHRSLFSAYNILCTDMALAPSFRDPLLVFAMEVARWPGEDRWRIATAAIRWASAFEPAMGARQFIGRREGREAFLGDLQAWSTWVGIASNRGHFDHRVRSIADRLWTWAVELCEDEPGISHDVDPGPARIYRLLREALLRQRQARPRPGAGLRIEWARWPTFPSEVDGVWNRGWWPIEKSAGRLVAFVRRQAQGR